MKWKFWKKYHPQTPPPNACQACWSKSVRYKNGKKVCGSCGSDL